MTINRIAYSGRSVPSLFPLDGMLNRTDLEVSYNLQKYLVLEIISISFDESIESIKRWTGTKITKEQTEKIVIESAKNFNKFYDWKEVNETNIATALPLIVRTNDGKGVVMLPYDLRDATFNPAENQKTGKSNSNFLNKNKSNSKRMAQVASVYEVARLEQKPETIIEEFFVTTDSKNKIKRYQTKAKRVWAGKEKSSDEVINEIFEEALQRDSSNHKEWVVLVDGDPNQIKKFQKLSKKFFVTLTIICDIIHVLEYLWKAGKALNDEEKLNS